MLGSIIELIKTDEFINDYYTLIIISKLDNKQMGYDWQIKDLDKQSDRIKTAHIKDIMQLEVFDI